MLITENYRDLNKQLHESNPAYGTSSSEWVELVKNICFELKTSDVLDYGCGKGLLRVGLRDTDILVKEYDPAVPGKEAPPDPADIVVCSDVLEHIEPECLDDVLEDLRRLMKKAGLFTIATRPALKTLPDGRNAHLIQESWPWWELKIKSKFDVSQSQVTDGETVLIVLPKKSLVKSWRPMNRVFIGYDPRQPVSYTVLHSSIITKSEWPISITPLILEQLPIRRKGLTPFTFTRFLVPWLCEYKGWALFLDVDMILRDDINKIFDFKDDKCAVMVVKNQRKFEWASMMLFNCEKCEVLTPEYIETANGLHTLNWTTEIGEIPSEYNHLVGYDPRRLDAKLVHFTQGIPAFPETSESEYRDDWVSEYKFANSAIPWAELMGQSVHTKHVNGELKPKLET